MLSVSVIFALGSAAVLLLSLWQLLLVNRLVTHRRVLREDFNTAVSDWSAAIGSPERQLQVCSQAVAEARSSRASAQAIARTLAIPEPRQHPELALFAERVGELIDACEQWIRRVGTTPSEIANLIAQAKKLREDAIPGFDAIRADARFWQLAEAIARTALNSCDDQFDSERTNAPIQQTLDNLLRVAALETIAPKSGDAVHPSMHSTVGSDRAPSEQWRGLISAVPRRGLSRDSDVLKRAEVRVFD